VCHRRIHVLKSRGVHTSLYPSPLLSVPSTVGFLVSFPPVRRTCLICFSCPFVPTLLSQLRSMEDLYAGLCHVQPVWIISRVSNSLSLTNMYIQLSTVQYKYKYKTGFGKEVHVNSERPWQLTWTRTPADPLKFQGSPGPLILRIRLRCLSLLPCVPQHPCVECYLCRPCVYTTCIGGPSVIRPDCNCCNSVPARKKMGRSESRDQKVKILNLTKCSRKSICLFLHKVSKSGA